MNGLCTAHFDSHTAVLRKKAAVGTLHVRPGPRRQGNIKKGLLKKYVGRASAGYISLTVGTSGRIFEDRVPYNAGIPPPPPS
jgi:hypothetical protein